MLQYPLKRSANFENSPPVLRLGAAAALPESLAVPLVPLDVQRISVSESGSSAGSFQSSQCLQVLRSAAAKDLEEVGLPWAIQVVQLRHVTVQPSRRTQPGGLWARTG